MPLQKLQLKPGVDRESTRYAAEGGWYEADKVRFRNGYPEKIGGWKQKSTSFFQGVCRSLMEWSTLGSAPYTAVGTHTHLQVERGGTYYDITPVVDSRTLGTDPIATVNASSIVTITDTSLNSAFKAGDRVIITGATAVGGVTLNGEYTIVEIVDVSTFTVDSLVTAGATATGGGATVLAEYLLPIGNDVQVNQYGWDAGTWSDGNWSNTSGGDPIRMWDYSAFGENLIAAVRGGGIYYWQPSDGTGVRATDIRDLPGSTNAPVVATHTLVSDVSRFVIVFGTNPFDNESQYDRMLIRWSAQESVIDWLPSATNQAGDIRLSTGAYIVTAVQSRQEILVWTDQALYSMQYIGPPAVWSTQLLSDNISIASNNSAIYVEGQVFWMGTDKFYTYDGSTKPLNSRLRKHVFDDINLDQREQFFVGLNEAFNEVWWFYCSDGSEVIDRYVIYNYVDQTWSMGTMSRTAWDNATINGYPIAATYSNNIVEHENGVDDQETTTAQPITAFARSAEFDLEDGDHFMFISRMIPDVRFDGSTAANPSVNMSMSALKNSGSGYNVPLSESSTHAGQVTRTVGGTVEQFTQQLNIRIRGRQAMFEVSSNGLGVQWQLGAVRFDMRPDGRR